MAHRVCEVEHGSIAWQCGIRPGDTLLSINGETVRDQIDYQFLTAREWLVLTIQDAQGVSELHLEKDEAEPLGLTFESSLMSRPRHCANRCVFCFVDQMPPGLRKSLYVKDDDWRLSLMMGNYITLTNLRDRELDRIIARRASPLYISIHAADGDVRARMMGNPAAADLMPQLTKLSEAGIQFHCQIVLCPGINDGAVLDDTLEKLAALYPAARSAALVPVGLTRFRDNLTQLTGYDAQTAAALLGQAECWQRKLLKETGTRFVFPADEFYCLSGRPLPSDEAYEAYPQLENGVGLLRSFEREFTQAYDFYGANPVKRRRVIIATGVSAASFFRSLIASSTLKGLEAEVIAVPNRFFGPRVTVAGLLTGQDILYALEGVAADEILISQAMLRHEEEMFLDGMPRVTLEKVLGIPVHAVACDGADFFSALAGEYYCMEA